MSSHCTFLVLLVTLVLMKAAFSHVQLSQFTKSFDMTPGYTVHWKLSADKSLITLGFNVTVARGNYFAFGIGEFTTGSMPGSDILAFEVSEAGFVDIKDYFAYGFSFPVLDDCQSWSLEASEVLTADDGSVNAVHAIVSRSTSIAGDNQDRPFEIEPDRSTQLLWAIGSSSSLSYHASNRGKTEVFFGGSTAKRSPSNLHSVDYRINNFKIPPQLTTYASQSFIAPSLDSRLYIRGFETVHGDGLNQVVLHHTAVYACEKDQNSSWVQRIFGNPVIEFNFECALIHTLAIGQDLTFFPDDLHMSMGLGAYVYFIIEFHYDNPLLTSGEVDNSGVRIYFETSPREHEAAVFQLGENFGMYRKPLPQGQSAVHLEFDCPSACTSYLPRPIHVFETFIHAHSFGRRIWSTIWRKDGVTSETLTRGEYFNFMSQRNSPVNMTVFPGDRLSAHCVYDTTQAPGDVYIGPGTLEEMCQVYVYYYPKVDFRYCGYYEDSSLSSENMTICGTPSNIHDIRNPSQIDSPSGMKLIGGSRSSSSCSVVASESAWTDSASVLVSTVIVLLSFAAVGFVVYFQLRASKDKINFTRLELGVTEG